VSAAAHIDPGYAEALDLAISEGVEVIVYGCEMSEQEVEIGERLPFMTVENNK